MTSFLSRRCVKKKYKNLTWKMNDQLEMGPFDAHARSRSNEDDPPIYEYSEFVYGDKNKM